MIILSDSVLLSDFVLDLFVDAFPGLSLGPSSDPLLDPFKSETFLVDSPTQAATFGPDPARPSFDLAQTPLGTDPGCVPSGPKHTAKPQRR